MGCAILAGMKARASGVFVGRIRELGELERVLDAARAGSGTSALVAGEAGIGKTRPATGVASRARDAGLVVLTGHSIDLVGTELPYQPFAEALRSLGKPWQVDGQTPGSQLRVFEETLALLTGRAASAPRCGGPRRFARSPKQWRIAARQPVSRDTEKGFGA